MTQPAYSIAIIDDDPMMSRLVEDLISSKFPTAHAVSYASGEEALASGFTPDLVILDYHLDAARPDALNGLQVLSKLKERRFTSPVVFISGQDRLEVATNTIKFGAHDYLVKNETILPRLEKAIGNALEVRTLRKTNRSQAVMNRIFWLVIVAFLGYIVYMRMH